MRVCVLICSDGVACDWDAIAVFGVRHFQVKSRKIEIESFGGIFLRLAVCGSTFDARARAAVAVEYMFTSMCVCVCVTLNPVSGISA